MIDIPKTLLSKVKAGESIELLEQYILNNYPMPHIIRAFAELIVTSEDFVNRPQIIVTEEEMQAIARLFRVKGQRIIDGEVITERRGRPRKM
jgi:hypothetical protein